MKVPALLLLAACLALPLHAANVVADPFPPVAFTALYIENDDRDGNTTVQLNGETLVYKKTDSGGKAIEQATIHPSGDDWFTFIQALNTAKVYNWAHTYQYPGQGPSWVIDVTMNDRKFYSEGTNEYPKNGNESQPQADPTAGASIPFVQYWQAVLALCGKAKPSAMVK
jgi:hypothetical protein